ncbi:hypothetical protein J5N97_001602 [Dioscorea zingiberensis]|uniref:Bifunctional inhibitor/plant lipid transfer protein/seed storage helical domain-containing protein n=1 Tax=Dioscorea zingiberensis TaxID=325984 RepID=A0A9D5H269_9LILI|nr:hypothetical protein J5N97_001602 [Dioscorea zingiberensis]
MGTSLPNKESNLFKVIVKSYETKQYKKGLKAADAILKKFPDHGETLAMKGLTLNCMDRKSEAYELVKRGLKNDLKSHVCWHVYGLLYRSDREYREAIKCYRNALKIDPDNIEILKGPAQMRDLTGFVETRQQLLTLKPNHRTNWIGFAVANHLNSNCSKSIEILEAYEGTLEDDYPPDNERYEHGEMLLYKISLLEECGLLDRALEEMHKKEAKIVDKLAFKEQMASISVKLGHLEEGEKMYRSLLVMNSDNYKYFVGLQKCVGLYSENGNIHQMKLLSLEALYKSLRSQYTWSSAAKRIPLDFLPGEKFREAADNYVRPLLTKNMFSYFTTWPSFFFFVCFHSGVPSLFSDLSPCMTTLARSGNFSILTATNILEQLFLHLESSLRSTGSFPGRTEKEPPSTLMWTLFYLAQHYDSRGQHDIALAKIDEAIEHTPTVIDLYSTKGRILERAGDFVAAAAFADEARTMDLADRYLNSECVRHMLQADQVALAEKTAVLFTKDGEQHNNLLTICNACGMFCYLWNACSCRLSFEKHYLDMTEDQFDFHSYCLRGKWLSRAYVSMLKFQDKLHSHAYFQKAAAGAIRCYMKLHDSPLKSATEEEENEMSKLDPSQKGNLDRSRKGRSSCQKEAEEKNGDVSSTMSKSGKRQNARPVDLDPHGEKLLQVSWGSTFGATKYLKLLQSNSSESLETHILSFELNMRKQKTLLAFPVFWSLLIYIIFQAVKQMLKLDENNPDCHRCLIKFFHKISNFSTPVTDSEKLVWNVLDAERQNIKNSLAEANEYFIEQNRDSLAHRAAAAEMLYVLEPGKKAEAIEIIEDSTNDLAQSNGALGSVRKWKLDDCIAVHKLLETVFIDLDAASRWKCCEDAEKVRSQQPKCLCVLIKESTDPSLALPINTTLALHLPKACNSDAKVSDCPSILKLSPDSPDAKIFREAGGDASTTTNTNTNTSTPSSSSAATNNSSGSKMIPANIAARLLSFVGSVCSSVHVKLLV